LENFALMVRSELVQTCVLIGVAFVFILMASGLGISWLTDWRRDTPIGILDKWRRTRTHHLSSMDSICPKALEVRSVPPT
jgi:hypothetical protein